MPNLFRWAHCSLVGAASALGLVIACGGSSSSNLTSPPANDGGTDAPTTTANGEEYTLDNVCDRTGSIICDLRKPCCETGVGFDQTACLAHARSECEKDVAAVRAGTMTFHGDRIKDCIPKYQAVFSTCLVTIDLLQKHIRTLAACEAFEGKTPEGSDCTKTNECAPGPTPDDIPGCDGTTKKCRYTKLLKENAACSLGPNLNTLCDDGLTCDIDQTFNGTCKPKIANQAPCDKNKNPNTQCGLGNYCAPTTGLCTSGKQGSEACTGDLECASVSCNEPDAGIGNSTCRGLESIVKPEECK